MRTTDIISTPTFPLYRNFIANYTAGAIIPGYLVTTVGANGVKGYQNIALVYIGGVEMALKWTLSVAVQLRSVNTLVYSPDYECQALPLMAPFRTANSANIMIRRTYVHL